MTYKLAILLLLPLIVLSAVVLGVLSLWSVDGEAEAERVVQRGPRTPVVGSPRLSTAHA